MPLHRDHQTPGRNAAAAAPDQGAAQAGLRRPQQGVAHEPDAHRRDPNGLRGRRDEGHPPAQADRRRGARNIPTTHPTTDDDCSAMPTHRDPRTLRSHTATAAPEHGAAKVSRRQPRREADPDPRQQRRDLDARCASDTRTRRRDHTHTTTSPSCSTSPAFFHQPLVHLPSFERHEAPGRLPAGGKPPLRRDERWQAHRRPDGDVPNLLRRPTRMPLERVDIHSSAAPPLGDARARVRPGPRLHIRGRHRRHFEDPS